MSQPLFKIQEKAKLSILFQDWVINKRNIPLQISQTRHRKSDFLFWKISWITFTKRKIRWISIQRYKEFFFNCLIPHFSQYSPTPFLVLSHVGKCNVGKYQENRVPELPSLSFLSTRLCLKREWDNFQIYEERMNGQRGW